MRIFFVCFLICYFVCNLWCDLTFLFKPNTSRWHRTQMRINFKSLHFIKTFNQFFYNWNASISLHHFTILYFKTHKKTATSYIQKRNSICHHFKNPSPLAESKSLKILCESIKSVIEWKFSLINAYLPGSRTCFYFFYFGVFKFCFTNYEWILLRMWKTHAS